MTDMYWFMVFIWVIGWAFTYGAAWGKEIKETPTNTYSMKVMFPLLAIFTLFAWPLLLGDCWRIKK